MIKIYNKTEVRKKYEDWKDNKLTDYEVPDRFKKYTFYEDMDRMYCERNADIFDLPAYAHSFLFPNKVMVRVLKSGETVGHKDDLFQIDILDYTDSARPRHLETISRCTATEVTMILDSKS